ncbi:MAG: hypothetical protein ACR2J6_03945 [Thermoleophilaceae bacterium]
MGIFAEPVVNWGQLLSVLWASALGGIGVTAAFAIALYGAVRAVDARRGGQPALAYGYWTLMALALSVVLAGVGFGVVVMTSKG